MCIINNTLIAMLIIASSTVCADPAYGVKTSPPAMTGQTRDSKNNDMQTLDCARFKTDPRCRPPQHPHYPPHHPDHYPRPYRPRPVIINQLPEQPAIEINSLSDDWDGCRKAKLGAIKARGSGKSDEANNLDDWLWKNCRAYSNELRQLEQDAM